MIKKDSIPALFQMVVCLIALGVFKTLLRLSKIKIIFGKPIYEMTNSNLDEWRRFIN